jgi:hypothetical protein
MYHGTIVGMSDDLAFMTPHHHAVRNFVVRELPRHGAPLSPTQIARSLRLDAKVVTDLLDDLEKHLFFLVRNERGEVSWAFPVTSDRTPHRLRFSTGEQIFGA